MDRCSERHLRFLAARSINRDWPHAWKLGIILPIFEFVRNTGYSIVVLCLFSNLSEPREL